MNVRPLGIVVALVLIAAACSGETAEVSESAPTSSDAPAVADAPAIEESPAPSTSSTTTIPVAERLTPPATDISGAVRAEDGTARAITGTDGELWFVLGACTTEASVPASTATLIGPRHVVLDPGGGGADRGVESGGVIESELNLDIALRTAELLRLQGVLVTLTREGDADLSSGARGALGPAVGAQALVSIHHGEPGTTVVETARSAVFHQIDDEQSRRLGGLVHEELVAAFGRFDQQWTAPPDPGVKPLLNQRGDNFHVVLDASADTPAVFVETAALGETETTLLSTEEGRATEAAALAAALVRFLVTADQGGGFIEPVETVRTAPTSNTPGGCTG